MLVIFLSGGVSQLETWDPKPNTDTGGPFKTIPTSVTGTHICELLPHTAKHMHRIALVRGLNSQTDDHGIGEKIMLTGRKPEAGIDLPAHRRGVGPSARRGRLGAAPGHIQISTEGQQRVRRGRDAAFLGPKFASVTLGDGKPPADLFRPGNLAPVGGPTSAKQFRKKLNERFAKSRKSAATDAYTESFAQADRVGKQAAVFDVEKEPARIANKYGRHDLGRHFLLARRLLEAGVTFVKVSHTNYDTHHENFDFHIEQLGEFDRPFAALLTDLAERGMLESTLVVVMSEMGRTPRINDRYGRDHWSKAWSVAVGGRRDQGRRGGRQDERQRHRRDRPRSVVGPPVPHVPASRGRGLDEEILPQRAARTHRRPEDVGHRRRAGVIGSPKPHKNTGLPPCASRQPLRGEEETGHGSSSSAPGGADFCSLAQGGSPAPPAAVPS